MHNMLSYGALVCSGKMLSLRVYEVVDKDRRDSKTDQKYYRVISVFDHVFTCNSSFISAFLLFPVIFFSLHFGAVSLTTDFISVIDSRVESSGGFRISCLSVTCR